MGEIYVLISRLIDNFDKDEVKLAGWTVDPREAGKWARSSSMYDRRSWQLLKEINTEKGSS